MVRQTYEREEEKQNLIYYEGNAMQCIIVREILPDSITTLELTLP